MIELLHSGLASFTPMQFFFLLFAILAFFLLLVMVVCLLSSSWGAALKHLFLGGIILLLLAGASGAAALYSYEQSQWKEKQAAEADARRQQVVEDMKKLQEAAQPAAADVQPDPASAHADASWQGLGQQLKSIELSLRQETEADDNKVHEIDGFYKQGQINTYDELWQKAVCEIHKREHIISAMDQKIALIQQASFLSEEECQAALKGNQERRDRAERERLEYTALLEQVRTHRKDYENF